MGSPTRTVNPDSPHLTEDQMRLYQKRELATEDLRKADKHLMGCGRCRRNLLAQMGPVALPEDARQMSEPLHLGYEQIAGYLDGSLTAVQKRQAESHLFLCASCNRELDGLKRFDARMAAPPAKAQKAVQAAAKAPPTVHKAVQPAKAPAAVPFTRRVAEFFRVPGRIRDFGLAFGAMAAGILVLIQANYVTTPGTGGSGDAARLLMPTVHGHPGLGMGGILLLFLGAGYLLYSLRRKK